MCDLCVIYLLFGRLVSTSFAFKYLSTAGFFLGAIYSVQGAEPVLCGATDKAGGHFDSSKTKVQSVEKTSRDGTDFPEMWLCPSPSFSFHRLASLGYM